MAAAWLSAARRASTLTSPSPALNLIPRRGLAGAADGKLSRLRSHGRTSSLLILSSFIYTLDHHGPPKVNFWQDPLSPSNWKEEHFVIVTLSGWGLLFYGGYKYFSGGKKDKEQFTEASH